MAEDNISFGRLVPMLTTDDLSGTIAFYRDTLGFEVIGTFPQDDPNWCYLKRGDSYLMFTSLGELDHDHDDTATMNMTTTNTATTKGKNTITRARLACGRSTSTRTTSSPFGRS